jgi:tRNA G18 (ribose-2'-O)-methylase SpoU
MPFVPVDSAADPRLRDYTGLTDVSLRRVREPAEGLFLAEGDKVIRRAIGAGYAPRSFLAAPRWAESLADAASRFPDAPFFVADEEVLRDVTGFAVHRGALASMHRRPLPRLDEVLRQARRVVVLEDLVDHTNVGAVMRSAAALGVDAVLVSPRCADPLYRRSVKVSMGAVFAVPWTRAEPWPASLDLLRDAGFVTWALTPAADAHDLRSLEVPERVAVLLGTEGDGLSPAALARTDLPVRIPMAHVVDSLNVAAASAVVCYALNAAAAPPST